MRDSGDRERLDEFAGLLSHDLRNPPSVIAGRLELFRKECDSEHLDSIAAAHDRMDPIVEDGLWLVQEGRDIGTTEPVNLREAFEATWEVVGDTSARSEFVDATSGDETIEADVDHVFDVGYSSC